MESKEEAKPLPLITILVSTSGEGSGPDAPAENVNGGVVIESVTSAPKSDEKAENSATEQGDKKEESTRDIVEDVDMKKDTKKEVVIEGDKKEETKKEVAIDAENKEETKKEVVTEGNKPSQPEVGIDGSIQSESAIAPLDPRKRPRETLEEDSPDSKKVAVDEKPAKSVGSSVGKVIASEIISSSVDEANKENITICLDSDEEDSEGEEESDQGEEASDSDKESSDSDKDDNDDEPDSSQQGPIIEDISEPSSSSDDEDMPDAEVPQEQQNGEVPHGVYNGGHGLIIEVFEDEENWDDLDDQ